MLKMLLVVLAAVLAVRILLSLIRPRKTEPDVKGKPQRPTGSRKSEDIEDADFREIK